VSLGSSAAPQNYCGIAMKYNGSTNDLEYLGTCTGNPATATLIMAMDRGGSVGIGASPTGAYKLQVCGSIRSTEVLVETGWCDYVFEEDYELRPLEEVEAFIKANKHLPEIPAGSVIETEGLALGEMSSKFILKIEELTLYTIEQEKKIKTQEGQIEMLLEEVQGLKTRLEKVEQN
jgi:hypothetical protein